MTRRFVILAVAIVPAVLAAQINVSFLQINVTCNGLCDGSATVSATGGTNPYTFEWSTGANSATAAGLCAGVYTVTVTDADQSTGTGTVTIAQPAPLVVSVDVEDQICGVVPDGVARAIAAGGTPPYGYAWSNGGTTAQISGLSQGTYTVTVTDANGCAVVDTGFVLNTNEGIWLMAVPTDILCFGQNNGSVKASPMSGTPPYTYHWNSPGMDTTKIISQLPPGTYTVTVTDTNGCSNTASASVAEPPQLGANTNTGPAACGQPGSATILPFGGVPPYTVKWSNDSTTTTISGPAGPVSVTVTDANNCTFISQFDIPGNNVKLSVSGQVLTSAGCVIGGSATVSVGGGSGNYAYAWAGGTQTATAANLPAGIYTVTVTDLPTGCTATATVTIPKITPDLSVSAVITSQVTCALGGSVKATAGGGLPPYAFAWTGGGTTAVLNNLPAGTYIVQVTDSTGCTARDTLVLVAPQPPSVIASVLAPATCSKLGLASAVASGGLPPYLYVWDTKDSTATANLAPGTHIVTVYDAGGCTAVGSVTIAQPPLPTVAAQATALANCLGGGGGASATASGGTPVYMFFWSNNQNTADATNLAAGTYTVTVTDAGGCTATASAVVGLVPQPSVSAGLTKAPTCTTPGTATATASGGTPPYAYLWSSGQTTAAIAGVTPGPLNVTITDAAGCTATASVTVAVPAGPVAAITAFTNASCDKPGTATVSATAGTGPYKYLWDNGDTTAVSANLNAGTHIVTVTDAAGCQDTASVVITYIGTGVQLGDFVWNDTDQDGIQHPSEKGVPNITVHLIAPGQDSAFNTADDIIVQTTKTDANGKYGFCAQPGYYIIKFSGLPQGYAFSPKYKGTNICKDSNARPDGNTDPVTVMAGQQPNLCIDAGIHAICENVIHAGVICCDQTICAGDTPALLYEVQPPFGGSGPIEYLWMQMVDMGPGQQPTWVAVPGGNQPTYQPGPLFVTTYFIRCVRRGNCQNFLETNMIKITVKYGGSCGSFLKSFNVTAIGAASARIAFTAQPEMAPFLYTVERSADNITWTTVERMQGQGNTTAPNTYAVIDQDMVNGTNYYRIRRLNADGSEIVSEVRTLQLQIARETSLAVYPNPVSQVLHIRNLMPYDADATVELYATDGTQLQTFRIPAGTYQHFEMPVGHWPQGLYLARIRLGDGAVQTVKVTRF